MKPENPDDIRGSRTIAQAVSTKKALRLDLSTDSVGTVVLHCEGRIIYGPEAHSLTALVADVLPTVGRIIVDMSGVESIDSAGLGELVLLHMWAKAAGGTLKFACPRPRVRELFELTNLASVLDTYYTLAEASAAMQDSQGARQEVAPVPLQFAEC